VKAYIDSDVLIWHLRGEKRALELLKRARDTDKLDLWTGAMQRAEVVFFMRPDEEEATLLLLSQFQTASVDQEIIGVAGKLYRQWNPRHGTDINDAILAATAMQTGGRIYTLNVKHYPMPEVIVQSAWSPGKNANIAKDL
jgi:predicted nucleic acid-binding protein